MSEPREVVLREALRQTYEDSVDRTIADDDFRETAGRRARNVLASQDTAAEHGYSRCSVCGLHDDPRRTTCGACGGQMQVFPPEDTAAEGKADQDASDEHPAGCFYGSFAGAYADCWHIPYNADCELDHGDDSVRLLPRGTIRTERRDEDHRILSVHFQADGAVLVVNEDDIAAQSVVLHPAERGWLRDTLADTAAEGERRRWTIYRDDHGYVRARGPGLTKCGPLEFEVVLASTIESLEAERDESQGASVQLLETTKRWRDRAEAAESRLREVAEYADSHIDVPAAIGEMVRALLPSQEGDDG